METTEAGPRFVILEHLEGTYLLDLGEADRIRDEIVACLEAARPGTVLAVQLDGVTTRASCIARFIGEPLKRITKGEIRDRYLVLTGPLDYLTDRDVRMALEDENVVAVIRDGSHSRLIGSTGRMLEETYDALLRAEEVSSTSLMSILDLDIKTANARIAKLEDVGLLRRKGETALEGGGRRFVYELVR